jgi:hypothetical protein
MDNPQRETRHPGLRAALVLQNASHILIEQYHSSQSAPLSCIQDLIPVLDRKVVQLEWGGSGSNVVRPFPTSLFLKFTRHPPAADDVYRPLESAERLDDIAHRIYKPWFDDSGSSTYQICHHACLRIQVGDALPDVILYERP